MFNTNLQPNIDSELAACCAQLGSSTLKERNQGVQAARAILSNPATVATLDHKQREAILNAFLCHVQRDREDVLKVVRDQPDKLTHSTAYRNRLANSASALRTFVELTNEHLGAKLLRPLITHLLDVLSTLKEPINLLVASDYAVALRIIVSHKPYRDHMPEEVWQRIFDVCLSALVPKDEDDDDDALLMPPLLKRSSSHMSTESIIEVDADGDATMRCDTRPLVQQPKRSSPPKALTHYEAELARAFAVILMSDVRMPKSDPIRLFDFFLGFFKQHETESTSHLYLLTALNQILAEITPNNFRNACNFAHRFVTPLLQLCGLKTKGLKIQALICLRLVFELVCHDSLRSGSSSGAHTDIERIHDKIQDELSNRNVIPNLPLGIVECVDPEPENDDNDNRAGSPRYPCVDVSPFRLRTLRGTQLNTYAPSWFLFDLAADMYYAMVENEHSTMNIAEEAASVAGHPVQSVWQEIREGFGLVARGGTLPQRIAYLQMLVFMIEKHGESMGQDALGCAWNLLTEAAASEDADTYHWACLGLRSVAYIPSQRGKLVSGPFSPPSTDFVSSHRGWSYVWRQTAHRIASVAFGEPSMELMHAMVATGRVLKEAAAEGTHAFLKIVGQDSASAMSRAGARFLTHIVRHVRVAEPDWRCREVGEMVLRWTQARLVQSGQAVVPEWLVARPGLLIDLMVACVGGDTCEARPRLEEGVMIQDEYIAAFRIGQMRPLVAFLDSGQWPGAATPGYGARKTTLPDEIARVNPTSGKQLTTATKMYFRDKIIAFLGALCVACLDGYSERPQVARGAERSERPKVIGSRSCATLAVCTVVMHTIVCLIQLELLTYAEADTLSLNNMMDEILTNVEADVRKILSYPKTLMSIVEQLKVLVFAPDDIPYQFGQIVELMYADRTLSLSLSSRAKHDGFQVLRSLRCAGAIAAVLDAACKFYESVSAPSQATGEDFDDHMAETKPSLASSGPSASSLGSDLSIEFYGASSDVAACGTSCSGLLPVLAEMEASPMLENETELYLNRTTDLSITNEQFRTLMFGLNRWCQQHVNSISFKQLGDILTNYADLISDYRFERDQWVLIAVIQCLTFLIPKWVPAALDLGVILDSGATIREIMIHFYTRLTTLWRKDTLSWRARLELGRFLLAYLTADPYQDLLNTSNPVPGIVFMRMFADDEFAVRALAGRTYAAVFDIYKYGEKGVSDHFTIYNDIKDNLGRDFQKYEQIATRVLTFGEVIVRSYMNQNKAIFDIVEIARQEVYLNMVRHALDDAAVRLGFDTGRELVVEFQQHILYSWIEVSHDLAVFPYQLFGYDNLEEFLTNEGEEIVAQLLLQRKIYKVHDISKMIGIEIKELLKKSFSRTFAHVQPLYFTDRGEEADVVINGFLQNQLGPDMFNEFYFRNAESMVFDLLLSVFDPSQIAVTDITKSYPGIDTAVATMASILKNGFSEQDLPEPCRPFYKVEIILGALNHISLTHCHTLSTPIASLFKPSKLHKILQKLHQVIQDSKLPYKRRRIMGTYRLAISLAGSAIFNVGILRMILHAMSLFMAYEEICIDCCGIVTFLCEWTTKNQPQVFVENLLVVVPLLIDRLSVYDKPGARTDLENQCRGCVIGLLEQLLRKASEHTSLPGASAIFSKLGPFPGDPAFAEICRIFQSLRVGQGSNVNFEAYESRLLASPSSAVVQACVRELREAFKAQVLSEELWNQMPKLHSLVGCLVRLCAREIDVRGKSSPLVADICRCLAEMYPFIDGKAAADHEASFHERGASRAKPSGAKEDSKFFVLRRLGEFLLDSDVSVVGIADSTLRGILSTKSGHNALDLFDETSKRHLGIFKSKGTITLDRVVAAPPRPKLEDNLLWATENKSYQEWIVGLCCSLLNYQTNDEVFGQLSKILEAKAEFADQMLPLLVHSALLCNIDLSTAKKRIQVAQPTRDVLSKQFRLVFQRHQSESKEALKALLNVIVFLRQQPLPTAKTPFDNNNWLELDYFDVAKAALRCKAYTTALLFVEIGCEPKHPIPPNEFQNDDYDLPDYQKLLLEIFRNMDEPDAFYGIRTALSFSSLSKRFEYEGSWSKNLSIYEARLQARMANSIEDATPLYMGLMKSMNNMGLYHLSGMYFKGLSSSPISLSPEIIDLQYELAWRNGTWNYDLLSMDKTTSVARAKFDCLRMLHSDERDSLASMITSSFGTLSAEWKYVNLEGCAKLQSMIKPLLSFLEIEESARLCRDDMAKDILSMWNYRLEAMTAQMSFQEIEETLALRTVVLDAMISKQSPNSAVERLTVLTRYIRIHLMNLARVARKSGQLQVASNALYRLQTTLNPQAIHTSDEFLWFHDATVEEAKQLWIQGESTVAIRMIKSLIKKLEGMPDANFKYWRTPKLEQAIIPKEMVYAKLLTRLGQWTAETLAEQPNIIMADYMGKAATMIPIKDKSDDMGQIFHTLAKYADEQYQAALRSDSQGLSTVINRHEEELRQWKEAASRAKTGNELASIQGQQRKLMAQLQHDSAEYRRITESVNFFLDKGVENYLQCLESSDKFDMCVFRLCSLWFSNPSRESLSKIILEFAEKVPSRKWIVLIFQLSARLSGNTSDPFQMVLTKLVEIICHDHPYHSLYQINALRSAKVKLSSKYGLDTDQGRIQAASMVMKSLEAIPRVSKIVRSIEALCKAYIELAYTLIPKNPSTEKPDYSTALPIGRELAISKIDILLSTGLPVATISLKVDPSTEYKDLTYIKCFKNTYQVIGGIHLPKIIECIGSDGRLYRQLVKSHDDMRQDAVMQQVFKIVDILLKKNLETRKRQLGIRTYKVIPLSRQAGVLEWVGNTATIGEWNMNAHPRYYPNDLLPSECRKKMSFEHAQPESTPQSKIQLYELITSQFHPVFRHFFMEHFLDPINWFERRLAYTRSVASTSIMGYALGLGDRHAQNILIDKGTAEVVHIDLGIAFDQGKVLPTAELVPFRLTRDMVDGMGVTGVEGVFRRCCEETLKVLRSQSYVLMMILEVFRFDPLYEWTVSPIKAQRIQGPGVPEVTGADPAAPETVLATGNATLTTAAQGAGNSSELTNKEAERALMGVKAKLASDLSVERHVNDLIQTATNPENLARMFPGWQPWC